AGQLEDLLHVLQVTLASFFRLGVGLGVVVTVGKPEAALIDVSNDLLGVVRILRRTGIKKHWAGVVVLAVGELQARRQGREVFHRLDLRNGIELGLNWRQAALFNRGFVHAGSVEVAGLLFDGSALRIG